ncbi:MAG: cation:proton antiporter [Acidimicrobiia bacterium]|jgi:predicted Kef-type K+ transport protein
MEVPLLLAAFGLGFAARLVKLPPLVGYLIAGFVLHALGVESSEAIDWIADIGVLLLLFGVGLKLQLADLAKPRVLVTTTVFSLSSTVLFGGALLLVGSLGVPLVSDLDLRSAAVVGFALSFASTVFAVQALERANESQSLAGRLSIGVLVLQDLFAVAFLVATGDGWPSAWALLLLPGLLVARPLVSWLLDRADHGEILILLGITLAVAVGAAVFDAVGLKPDLGALVAGLLLSGHPRAGELSSTLLGFKDLFLVGFFLSIGLAGIPPIEAWFLGAALLLVVPIRTVSFLGLFTRFHVRARTSLHAGLTLSTYSEFGLIVGSAAVAVNYLSQEWVSTVAVAVAGSFIAASYVNARRYRIYQRFARSLAGVERHPIVTEDAVVDCGWARVLIFGMGRIGEGAYDEIVRDRPNGVVGVDRSAAVVDAQSGEGRSVVRGDALDLDFWERFQFHPEVELVFAAMNSHQANLECVRRVREFLPKVRIAAIARYGDQIAELQQAGVDVARNLYEEAGQALAADAVGTVWESEG